MKRRNNHAIAIAATDPSIVVHNGVTHSGVACCVLGALAEGPWPLVPVSGTMVPGTGRLVVSRDVMVPTVVMVLVIIWLEVTVVLA